MTIPFNAFFRRIVERTNITTQIELAKALNVNRSAITQAKLRNAVPQKWILALSRRYALSPDWLEFGVDSDQAQEHNRCGAQPFALPEVQLETVLVPKVQAKLCAGGGSFELEAVPVAEHPLPYTWLSRMGNPNAMVFMDVIGNSMEPGIRDGDMVLVDQSHKETTTKSILAVGYEEAIYIKRLEKRTDSLIMISDNPEYAPMVIAGDELNSFRVIGKVVWLCRDCRYF